MGGITLLTHFGVKIKEKPGNHINKDTYLSAKPEGMIGWTEEHYPLQRKKADLNYDLNMSYFASIKQEDFDDFLGKIVKKYKFNECFDLKELSYVEGVYMLVLDEFKQVYIGISSDIKKRIMTHWSSQKSLERLIFGDICNSILSVDSFGAFDTTRIFYIKTYSTYSMEEKIVSKLDTRFSLNRTAGGIGSADTYTDDSKMAALAVTANRRTRGLIEFLNIQDLKAIVSEKTMKYYFDRYPELKRKEENLQ